MWRAAVAAAYRHVKLTEQEIKTAPYFPMLDAWKEVTDACESSELFDGGRKVKLFGDIESGSYVP